MANITYLTMNWTDEFGGVFPNAHIAVWNVDVFSHIKLRANEEIGQYTEEGLLDGLSYTGNFWYSKSHQDRGFDSRPLIIKVDGESTNIIKVDLEHHESVQIQNSAMTATEKALALITADIRRRLNK